MRQNMFKIPLRFLENLHTDDMGHTGYEELCLLGCAGVKAVRAANAKAVSGMLTDQLLQKAMLSRLCAGIEVRDRANVKESGVGKHR